MEAVNAIRGSPWQSRPSEEDVKVAPAQPQEVHEGRQETPDGRKPQRFFIRKEDVRNMGGDYWMSRVRGSIRRQKRRITQRVMQGKIST